MFNLISIVVVSVIALWRCISKRTWGGNGILIDVIRG